MLTLKNNRCGQNPSNFLVTLKPDVELKRQRPSKVPLKLKDKLQKPLTQLKDADVIRERGDDDEMGSQFVNPVFLMQKKRLCDVSDWREISHLSDGLYKLLLALRTSAGDDD